MRDLHVKMIAKELNLQTWQVNNTLNLFDEKATVPFISRYRKEATGSLDEMVVAEIGIRAAKLNEIEKRKETILKTIEEQGALTPELKKAIEQSYDTNELEDLYLPYKPKRKTKASIAKERGLEPLANLILEQREREVFLKAERFINDQVPDVEAAVEGASHIIAEVVNEHKPARDMVRNLFTRGAVIRAKLVKGKEEEGEKYSDYFDFEEPLKRCSSHRLLAMRRAENEGILKVSIQIDDEPAIYGIERLFIKSKGEAANIISNAIKDGYKRLLEPSVETEFAHKSKEIADKEAIGVFAENLRQLLLSPPLGEKRILAIDPGYRTGCKVVCIDEHGRLLHNETIYPHPPQNERVQAMKKIESLTDAYKIEAIAIGNGTAGRETEQLIKNIRFSRDLKVFVVSEAGASVYSASKIARDEFPQYDVTVRGSVSIGRRLADPLAELVKIDPKSIGVGQYQHDVDQTALKATLDSVVENCVNTVGVDLNTAGKHLLTYVSGLGPQLAQNIVDFRTENGKFVSRDELKKVARMGPKAYEQCAGFLRIRDGKNILDSSAVHPESYKIVEKMAKDLGAQVADLVQSAELRKKITLQNYVTDKVGLPTLTDIVKELEKPGRDPRSGISVFEFDPNLQSIKDVKEGGVYPGVITNITNFGAFVDIGIKENGLIHVSNMANKYISNPNEVIQLSQQVMVKVIQLDIERKRIGLSLKDV